MSVGPGRHVHDWFNAKAAATLVEASQSRVSRRSLTLDTGSEGDVEVNNDRATRDDFAEDEMALRDAEDMQRDNDESGVMDTISTQTQTIPQSQRVADEDPEVEVDDDGEELQEVSEVAPPVFRPLAFAQQDNLEASVKRRLRKNHEVVLEEQPKWALLATILKEIEDTIARVTESHAGKSAMNGHHVDNAALSDQPGNNIVLVMTASDRTCLQLRQYLTTMEKTDPPFGPKAGRKMMETLFLSNWQHEKNGERLSNPAKLRADEVSSRGEIEKKKNEEQMRKRGVPSYKRRRTRAGAVAVGKRGQPDDM
jgi:DNA excision repair protein ERCC-4